MTTAIAWAEREWPHLRGLLRCAYLMGDVQISGSLYDNPPSGERKGVDTDRRIELLDVERALVLLDRDDGLACELLRRDVGRYCKGERCERADDGPHWHRIPWGGLFNSYSKEALQHRFDAGREYVTRCCNGGAPTIDTVIYNQAI